ncbi:polynucleotide kinase-phosphatase [Propionicicella superfundia]|uniref:polynucleotide kinase-phosphatase n=1 Tax=Propionicicella superfundia TaxID=348582 RepID=UPI0003FC3C1F|nr:polynucleotide kinase-phosphatase [Propionicicella superfundia]
MRELHVPALSLVALVGVSGSGKSTFGARAFAPFEVIGSDFCRGLVSGDENDQAASGDAFDVLHYIVGKRLDRGLLTVVDATNVSAESRAALVALARDHDVLPVALVLDVDVNLAIERNRARPDRAFGEGPVRRQHAQLRRSLRGGAKEGFRAVHVLKGPAEIDEATIVRDPLLNDRRSLHGPFDIVGDVHGCLDELLDLLATLGYAVSRDDRGRPVDAAHAEGRTAVFLGDLVDRGPAVAGVLRLVMGMTAAGHALAVPGNHEAKLVRALDGRNVNVSHGLAQTLAELDAEPPEFRRAVRDWCYDLVSHLVLDDGNLVVAHAGLKEAYHGRASGRVRSFALYGDTDGETDEFGLPVRYPWAEEYRGRALVAYGHTPTTDLEWVNNTICLDTGCVFGGMLSALRYPERETVQVPARAVHCEPVKPLGGARPAERPRDELRLDDVLGRRAVETAGGRVTVTAENAAGAFEVMSRFALHPRLVPYLPATMCPVATSQREGYLEHPEEAFAQYAAWSVGNVVCEEKHMGSRAVVYLRPDGGAVYTRTGRTFFPGDLTETLLGRVRAAATTAGLFGELGSEWLLLDAELLPWSAKSMGLLREQYAPVGAAAELALPSAVAAVESARARGLDVTETADWTQARLADARAYAAAWRRYVWPTEGLDGVQLAVFQVLAAEGRTFVDVDHRWHLDLSDRLVAADPGLFRATRRRVVDLAEQADRDAATAWWEGLTADGGEGMIVKPLPDADGERRWARDVQPGVKVRGPEYLRIIYGPEYARPGNLARLRSRSLRHKASLAIREHALGRESLDRLVRGEPLWRVHEAVFAVLALESEPVDPRL